MIIGMEHMKLFGIVVILALGAFSWAQHVENEGQTYEIDLEGYEVRFPGLSDEWSVNNAELTALTGPDGQSHVDLAFIGEGWASSELEDSPEEEVVFYTFKIRAVVGLDIPGGTLVNVAGAVLGYRLHGEPDGIQAAEITLWDAGPDGLGEWMHTNFYLGVDEETGRITSNIPITIRIDRAYGIWDFFIGMRISRPDLGPVPTDEEEGVFILAPGTGIETVLRKFSSSETNPLYEDADNDGVKDHFEVENGFDPTVNDRDQSLTPGGPTLIELYMSSRRCLF